MLMTMQKKWEPHWLPGRTIGGLKSIFSLQHARLAEIERLKKARRGRE